MLVGKEVAVEVKNDLVLMGTLHSVDQYLNVKLGNERPRRRSCKTGKDAGSCACF